MIPPLSISTITTNLMGPTRMTSALIEHLKGKDDAVVAYTSSVLGFRWLPLRSIRRPRRRFMEVIGAPHYSDG
jgi:hypothetical protein